MAGRATARIGEAWRGKAWHGLKTASSIWQWVLEEGFKTQKGEAPDGWNQQGPLGENDLRGALS